MKSKTLSGLTIFLLIITVYTIHAQTCYELVWNDEFNYTGQPDSTKWTHEVGGAGWGNNELQYYTEKRLENARVENGNLIIEARKEYYKGNNYTSARLITYNNNHTWRYGKIEAKIKLPYGQGIWAAFWMLGNGIFEGTAWPACGEIDIMEMIGGGEGRDDMVYGTIHWADLSNKHAEYGGHKQLSEGIFADTFHVFSIEWNENSIKWFVDGLQFHVVNIEPVDLTEFRNEFFLLLNLAVGGNWPGNPDGTTVFPQQMLVDYVRIYQQNKTPEIIGDTSIIAGQKKLQFSTLESDEFSYSWTVPADVNIIDGQGTNSILVDWACNPGTIYCNITTLCKQYNLTKDVALKKLSINGKDYVLENQLSLNYSVPTTRNANYNWILPDGVSLNSKSDSNLINIDWNDVGGEIKLKLDDYCGTDSALKQIEILVQLPYPNPKQAHIIPGTIQSLYYDMGGEGIAYHDKEAENLGTGSRQNEGVDTEANDGGENVGWIENGEWLEYSVQAEENNFYDLEVRLASPNSTGKFKVLFNGNDRTGTISVPLTGAWNSFKSITAQNIYLTENDTLMRIEMINGGFNLGRLIFSKSLTSSTQSGVVKNDINIYPTISSQKIYVTNIEKELNYSISDMTGRIVKNGVIHPNSFVSINELNEGAYIIIFTELENTNLAKSFFKVN